MLSGAYSAALCACFALGRLGLTGALSIASLAGCLYAPLLLILLHYGTTCTCRGAQGLSGALGGKGSGGATAKPQPPSGWRRRMF